MAEIPIGEQIAAVEAVVKLRRNTAGSRSAFLRVVTPDGALLKTVEAGLDREQAALEAALKTLKRLAWTDEACPDGCDHTIKEHCAFDEGVMAGERGEGEETCPHHASDLIEAWLTGHSVGLLNREGENARTANNRA